jgi:ABC-2 type transport system permease protein
MSAPSSVAERVATARVASAKTPGSAAVLAGTAYLLRFMLRRNWVRLTVWSGSLVLFCGYYVVAIGAVYPNAADRQNRATSVANAGGTFLAGPGYGLEHYTIGAMFANEMSLWLIALLATMNILMIARNTRAEEASGRTELVRALPVGRHATSVAAFLVVVIADGVFALFGSALLIGAGQLAAVDTVTLMVGVMLTALVFAGITTVTGQLTVNSRGASGIAFAALAAAVLIRGIGDIQERHGSWVSWLSPIGWTQQTRAYVDVRLWPLGLSVVAIVVALALGANLASRRDLGDALFRGRPGPADAAPSLSGPFALVVRQQRGALLWWLVGCVAMFGPAGLFLGADSGAALGSIADQNSLTSTIFGDDPIAAFLAIMMLHNALAVAVFTTAAVLRVKPEEDEGRLGLSLSRAASRTSSLLAHLSVAGIGALVLLFVGGALPLWAGASISGGDTGLPVLLKSAGAFALGIAVLITFTAALYAWVPRASPLAWVLCGLIVVERFFGSILHLPIAIKVLSPFWWVGSYPKSPLDPAHLIGLGAAAAVLLTLAVIGFRRRDLTAG